MKTMKKWLLMSLPLLLAVTSVGANQAKAWDGGGGYEGPPWGFTNCCESWGHQQGGCGGYCAGQEDAAYDVSNSLQYQPYGNCLPCHSSDYWSSFRQGYDTYWNSHQSQEQSQGADVNIYGNGNYVSINQGATQNPLQQLAHAVMAHAVCGLINCQQQPIGYVPYGQQYQSAGYGP